MMEILLNLDGELYQQVVDNLCSKLSVEPTTFSVFSLDTLSAGWKRIGFSCYSSCPGIITLNLSLVDPPPLLHLHISEMPIYSSDFYLCSRLYTLSLLLHDRDYLHQARYYQFSQQEITHSACQYSNDGAVGGRQS